MSDEKQETVADIVAELRRQSNEEHAFVTELRSSDCDDVDFARACCYDEDAKYLSQIADRIEAAAKRQKAEADPVGNAAAMRDALVAVLDENCRRCYINDQICTQGLECHWNGKRGEICQDEVMDKAIAALSAPPRNCDMFSNLKSAQKYYIEHGCSKGLGFCVDGEIRKFPWKSQFEEWLFDLVTKTKGDSNEQRQ